MQFVRAVGLGLLVALFASCSSGEMSESSNEPIFGTEDTVCASVELRNEDNDEQLLTQAIDCLFGEIEAGRPVTVDVSAASVEGDPIYNRYAFDGDDVLIVEDNRADEFGRPAVITNRCRRLERDRFLPQGIDCESADHPGFPEAVR